MRIAMVGLLGGVLGLAGVAVAVVAGMRSFHRANLEQARALLARAPVGAGPILSEEAIAGLPAPVSQWLRASGAVGRPRARTVRLLQRGGMRTAPNRPYMAAEATQYFTIDDPGFVWLVDVTMMTVVPVVGRDLWVNGAARMLIKAGGLVTVADGTGPKFDQGAALRFLVEIVWFPSAALAPYITWEAIDGRHARATIAVAGVSAPAVFEFDDRGRVTRITAERYLNGASLETWEVPITAWRTIRGIEMPVAGGAVWKLAAGDFDYYQWEILDVEPDRAELWGDAARRPGGSTGSGRSD